MSYARLFDVIAKGSKQAFPNVGQHKITADDLERSVGDQWETVLAGVTARLDKNPARLTKATYHVKKTAPWLSKPLPGWKTCTPAAHTQQIGMEECLLQWSGSRDADALSVLTRSWAILAESWPILPQLASNLSVS